MEPETGGPPVVGSWTTAELVDHMLARIDPTLKVGDMVRVGTREHGTLELVVAEILDGRWPMRDVAGIRFIGTLAEHAEWSTSPR